MGGELGIPDDDIIIITLAVSVRGPPRGINHPQRRAPEPRLLPPRHGIEASNASQEGLEAVSPAIEVMQLHGDLMDGLV